ncbi:nuclear pore complex protein Nup50-like [Argonauta hians]
MSKRIATTTLTDRNWNDEEEEEEAGEFAVAEKNVLKQRFIIKAKRRGPASTTPSGGGLFAGFSGFTSTPLSRPSINSSSSSTTNNNKTPVITSPFAAAGSTTPKMPTPSIPAPKTTITPITTISSTTAEKSHSDNGGTGAAGAPAKDSSSGNKFPVQLKKLNEGVLQWIQQHVKQDPYCILTPIFDDYRKHLDKIHRDDESKAEHSTDKDSSIAATTTNMSTSATTTAITTPSSQLPLTKEGGEEDKKTTSASENSKDETETAKEKTSSGSSGLFPGFSLKKPFETSTTPVPTVTGTAASSSTAAVEPPKLPATSVFGGFSFKSADTQSPFSFASNIAAASANNMPKSGNAEEEDEYVPPKAEVKEIKEDGSVYTKRCKLFYEKDKNWIDKGIGNLHVKPFKDKAQLIIRADTNLGNILLNIMLLPTMQLKRQGKNNVSLVCIPNPPLTKGSDDTKPVPMLIRVKSSDEADELLEQLNTHKLGTDSTQEDD